MKSEIKYKHCVQFWVYQNFYPYLALFIYISHYLGLLTYLALFTLIWPYLPLIAPIWPFKPYSPYMGILL